MVTYITLIGKRGSGKDVFSEYVLQKYNIPSVRFSSVITELGGELGIKIPTGMPDKEKAQYIGNFLRREYGERFYTERIASQVRGRTHIINGARQPEEIYCLRQTLKKEVVTVSINSDDENRFNRLFRSGIVCSREHFEIFEANKSEVNIEMLLRHSDFNISNNDSLEEFYRTIDELMAGFKI